MFVHIVDPDDITFECERLWQTPEYLFWFNLTWTLPPYLLGGNVISNFVVNPKFKDGTATISLPIDNVMFSFPQVI